MPSTMLLDSTERLYLERRVTLARATLVALSLLALLETSRTPVRKAPVIFLSLYLLVALVAVLCERLLGNARIRMPVWVDFAALAAFLFLAPSISALWFLFLLTVFALATRGNPRAVVVFVAAASAAITLRMALADPFHWQGVWRWFAIGMGTLVSGLGVGLLGAREREHFARHQFLERITGHLQFDRGLTESVRQALGELALAFECEKACLAVRDDDLERLFVWTVSPGEPEPRGPETISLTQSDTFLLDSMEVSLCWDHRNGRRKCFGWDRRTHHPFRLPPLPPESTWKELGATSLLAATIESGGRPAGRVLLIDGQAPHSRRRFSPSDLRWLEQVVRHIGAPLENLFLLRNLRARAVESERSRISRDLHDGVLQTLLSLNIQLGVLHTKVAQTHNPASEELANLQKMVRQESEELRRMVTDLRPLRVESADMKELMFGFAERFRNEHRLAVDLFIEDRNLRVPDRICRELFQIYRESLHNIKKHANASHVVVKLRQDESNVFLVVDDNGRGFSFSGRYTSEELDRLRLGPISIKERTRSVGGTLTVESNPGHGARLIIEIPLS
ncbi:MAG: sensor histidine kinase [Candidatus Acidiferrales bacterium]